MSDSSPNTPTMGRRRAGKTHNVEDETLSQIAKEAEARLAQKRAARIEAREIRMRELERQQREDKPEREWDEKGGKSTRPSSIASGNVVYNHSASSSLSGNDLTSAVTSENSSSHHELKGALSQVEEKYRQAMVQSAQLENERSQLQYQTNQLKDLLEEQEDELYRLQSDHKSSCQELERQKRTNSSLQKKCHDLQESLRQRDELIQELESKLQNESRLARDVFDLKETVVWKDKKIEALLRKVDQQKDVLRKLEQGLVVVGTGSADCVDGPIPAHENLAAKIALVTPEAAEMLQAAGDGPLDSRLKILAEEKQDLLDQVRRLKLDLEEERRKVVVNGNDDSLHADCRLPEMELLEIQREANKMVNEYKLKLQKSEQDISACHGNIARLESQLSRLKQTSEMYEKNEDEMRAEKRKLMRDLRTALDRIEEMEMTNSHLEKRLERVRASRTTISQT